MIVADTGAIVALVDASDRHHRSLLSHFARDPVAWILPWAILPEVDYLLLKYLGARVERLFCQDVVAGRYRVERQNDRDLARAAELNERYAKLELGLVDGVVMAVAERLKAREIATLDVRDFAAVDIVGAPRLIPRDL
jgi:predicted nucleic acid-binding protein